MFHLGTYINIMSLPLVILNLIFSNESYLSSIYISFYFLGAELFYDSFSCPSVGKQFIFFKKTTEDKFTNLSLHTKRRIYSSFRFQKLPLTYEVKLDLTRDRGQNVNSKLRIWWMMTHKSPPPLPNFRSCFYVNTKGYFPTFVYACLIKKTTHFLKWYFQETIVFSIFSTETIFHNSKW